MPTLLSVAAERRRRSRQMVSTLAVLKVVYPPMRPVPSTVNHSAPMCAMFAHERLDHVAKRRTQTAGGDRDD